MKPLTLIFFIILTIISTLSIATENYTSTINLIQVEKNNDRLLFTFTDSTGIDGTACYLKLMFVPELAHPATQAMLSTLLTAKSSNAQVTISYEFDSPDINLCEATQIQIK